MNGDIVQNLEESRKVLNDISIDNISLPDAASSQIRITNNEMDRNQFKENERERDLLQRERELLRRERELLDRERSALTATSLNLSQRPFPCRDTAERLLPDFDPSNLTGLTARQWINRIESVSEAYGWDQGMILSHVVGKLRGAAKFWFDGVVEDVMTWCEFRNALLRSFPTAHDQADIHMELTRRRKGKNEDYETYVYLMKAIARRGGIEDRSLVKYVLNGLEDRELARSLSLCEFSSIEEFLRRIKNYESVEERSKYVARAPAYPKSKLAGADGGTRFRDMPSVDQPTRRSERDVERGMEIKCFNCNKKGHLARDCRQPTVRGCFRCGIDGHIARDCNIPNRILRSGTEENKGSVKKVTRVNHEIKDEYYKWVEINGKKIVGFIDLGSDVVTMRQDVADEIKLKYEKCQQQLRGFGDGACMATGRNKLQMKLEDVVLEVETFIVPSGAQEDAIIIGRSALDQSDIKIVKENGTLTITKEHASVKTVSPENAIQCKDKNGIRPGQNKIEAVREFKKLETVHQMKYADAMSRNPQVAAQEAQMARMKINTLKISAAGKREGELHNIERIPIPFHTVNVDHLGPFPKSSQGNTHALVYVDNSTKFTIIRGTKSAKTCPVTKCLHEIAGIFGSPARIISDRGTAYTSRHFEEYCKKNMIKYVKNATATPRANGQAERVIKTITTGITTSSSNESGYDWDKSLRDLQWMLNNTKNKSTKNTPNELLFGFNPRNALQNKIILAQEDDFEENEVDLQEVRESAAKNIREEQRRQKIRFDARHKKPHVYSKNDLVLVRREVVPTGQPKKLMPHYKGPYMVSEVLPNDRYVLIDIPGAERTQRSFRSVFASDLMKPWCILPDLGEGEESSDDDGVEDDTSGSEADLSATGLPLVNTKPLINAERRRRPEKQENSREFDESLTEATKYLN